MRGRFVSIWRPPCNRARSTILGAKPNSTANRAASTFETDCRSRNSTRSRPCSRSRPMTARVARFLTFLAFRRTEMAAPPSNCSFAASFLRSSSASTACRRRSESRRAFLPAPNVVADFDRIGWLALRTGSFKRTSPITGPPGFNSTVAAPLASTRSSPLPHIGGSFSCCSHARAERNVWPQSSSSQTKVCTLTDGFSKPSVCLSCRLNTQTPRPAEFIPTGQNLPSQSYARTSKSGSCSRSTQSKSPKP
mmetsp:Transcript_23429/g.55283  ORF Transcript_23429/g.55283 Transcript_23429/m.55283 type:complete len:250 (-) Transcript_23429:158-907(-)